MVHPGHRHVSAALVRLAVKAERDRRLRVRPLQRSAAKFAEALPPTLRGSFVAKPWQARVLARLQAFFEACARGESPRVLFTVPPQYGKTESVKRATAWALGQLRLPVGLGTYSADLAQEHSRDIKSLCRSDLGLEVFPGLSKDPENDRVDSWRTGGGGRLYAVGVGGPLTGTTLRAMLIDDPNKDEVDACTAAGQRRVWNWYRSVVYTRASANKAGILVMHTRWSEGDLIGRLLEEADRGGDRWEVIDLPALARDDDWLGREPGEPLDPSLQTVAELQQAKRVMGSQRFEALYQQQPTPDEGALYLRDWLSNRYQGPPTKAGSTQTVISVDGAATDGSGDHTVLQLWAFDGTAKARLLEQWRGQWGQPAFESALKDAIAKHRPSAVLIEDTSNGRGVRQRLQRTHRGIIPISVSGLGDKRARIRPTLGLWESGAVQLPEARHAPWVSDFVARMLRVTGQGHEVDDEADAATIALAWWQRRAARTVRVIR